MKIRTMLLGLSAVLALSVAACSGDEDTPNTGDGDGDMVGDGDGDGDMVGDGDGDGDMGGSGNGTALLGPDNRPDLGDQIDRAGRPAITTALIETFNGNVNQKNNRKDAYNAATPGGDVSPFQDTMELNLAILDGLDEDCTNQLGWDDTDGYEFLAGVLLDDQLYVNSTVGECGVYLGAESEVLEIVEPGEGKCGGRTPLDDVVATSYSVLSGAAGFDDTVTEDDVTHSNEDFPFLASPNN